MPIIIIIIRVIQIPNNLNNSNFYEIRFVICFVCGSQAYVKPTRTHRLMLRCDFCRALMFANADVSQKYLLNLLEYKEDF